MKESDIIWLAYKSKTQTHNWQNQAAKKTVDHPIHNNRIIVPIHDCSITETWIVADLFFSMN